MSNYLNCEKGLKSWLFTLDHKRIGVMYLIAILTFFLLGGIFAMLLRTELVSPEQVMMSADTYNRVFTLHGAVMIFLFIIPSIPAALGNFVLPLQLGAKDVAFPRLNLLSFWLYVIGALFAAYSLFTKAVDTGWTFYTPYSTTSNSSVISMVTGAFVLGFSSILTGLNFIVTIHKMRPRWMSWFKMPLFLWSLYATALIQILATPVLGITLLLLIAERVMHVGIFDPAMGGDPVLFQHFFWFYSHPAVYIMILPAMGIISELMTTFSRKPIFGYKAIAYSSVAIAFFGFMVWGHHMFVSGQSALANMIFSLLTFSVSIPSAIKVFNWLATLYKGSIRLDSPMLYALSFILLFAIGGLTGLFLGTVATDVHLHDTYFVVAHFHYTMMGGTLIAFLAGLHFWWPKMFGKMYNELAARIALLMIFLGFNVTFFTQFFMGSKGMPRRYFHYPAEYQGAHQLSTIGSYLMALGFVLIAIYLVQSLLRGKKAPANPWGASTLDWATTSPPIHHNFESTPEDEGDPYNYKKLRWNAETANWDRSKGGP
ncbi:MAG: cytochrome c oxidase subunit I [Candidatus Krumholzibacteria bacterium]|nr:cytochrome c oxidase subunit I [Candidatus Krumholzibacteria bacterium]MDP6669707.1 cytochrome c oxidase subunit I [Candidatus Krumholzibacteria bacterium]MDP6796319.1 cytochrome c oxidase subunit I [Candidatus Krumholzibacteria bacterium]MDP7021322.1 cytochrome c oxidase subunit I [Candidatus Krumholzibacteria bacterium]